MSDYAIADPEKKRCVSGSGINPPVAGNTATGWLKIIALIFMLIDHMGAVIFSQVQELRIIGRLAFPIYCWCMIVGFCYTRCVWKYLLRILVVGLISQPIYAFALNHLGNHPEEIRAVFHEGSLISSLFSQENLLKVHIAVNAKPNIFLTLFLALGALWGIREKRFFSHLWAPVLALSLSVLLGADYGWKGVLFVLLLYACRTSRPALAAVMIAFFLYWGTTYGVTQSFFGIKLDFNRLPAFLTTLLTPWFRLETYGLLSLPFILIRFPKNLRMNKWVGYALYPAHLLLIILLKAIIL